VLELPAGSSRRRASTLAAALGRAMMPDPVLALTSASAPAHILSAIAEFMRGGLSGSVELIIRDGHIVDAIRREHVRVREDR
jgi:hypothetical protein